MNFGWTICVIVLLAGGIARADERLFRERVVPILEARCVHCHEGVKPKGGLSLVTAELIRKGGESGPALVAGKPDESLLVDYIRGKEPEMPKGEQPLAPAEVAVIREWVAAGAEWPTGVELADRRQYDLDWWSLRPLKGPSVPSVNVKAPLPLPSSGERGRNQEPSPGGSGSKLTSAPGGRGGENWCRTPVDAFVLAKLREKNLSPSPEADRRTLVRRLYFDLTGLPPSFDEVEAFVADADPHAYEKLVDRLLESPDYGERWARHWLDVVHYGDTHGYDKDKVRPNAWPYRDYVIRAFNDDKPYGRFVEEQVAGDVLYPGTADGIIATGFIAAGPFDFVGQIEVAEGTMSKAITRNLDRDDMVTTTIGTFNSMTVQCARCHSHKFDPITQEDYYSLQAVFAGVDRAERPYPAGGGVAAAGVVFAAANEFKPEGQHTPTHGKPRVMHVLKRGSEKDPGAEVGPGTCGYLPQLGSRFAVDAAAGEGVRRVALARWLTSKENPLTWRSIVNRVWQYHFGHGIVETPNDFGRMGAPPSNVELLDWLAAEFRDGRQSIKDLHRLICTSAVYRQASVGNVECEKVDGANQYLWRMNRRRLEAEALRDSVLVVAGQLDATRGGPPFRAFGFKDDHSPHYKYEEYNPDDPTSHRRSVYRMIVRSVPDPFMTTLDCADASALVPRRNETLTPLQSLALLNNPFMVRMAERFAERVTPRGASNKERLAAAWQLAFARQPAEDEIVPLVEYAGRRGLANACRLIFNLNEFVFVD